MDLFQLREQFSREGIMICFNGPLSHSIIEEMGTAIKNYLEADAIARMAVQDVFAAYIEMAQNVRNYQMLKKLPPGDIGSATILIAKTEDTYAVTSGNVILNADVEALVSRIELINSLQSDALKKMIRQQLHSETTSCSIGAGIGMMEMAKRSNRNLEYSIRNISEEYSFYTLKVYI
jgi:hypothetical protein